MENTRLEEHHMWEPEEEGYKTAKLGDISRFPYLPDSNKFLLSIVSRKDETGCYCVIVEDTITKN